MPCKIKWTIYDSHHLPLNAMLAQYYKIYYVENF